MAKTRWGRGGPRVDDQQNHHTSAPPPDVQELFAGVDARADVQYDADELENRLDATQLIGGVVGVRLGGQDYIVKTGQAALAWEYGTLRPAVGSLMRALGVMRSPQPPPPAEAVSYTALSVLCMEAEDGSRNFLTAPSVKAEVVDPATARVGGPDYYTPLDGRSMSIKMAMRRRIGFAPMMVDPGNARWQSRSLTAGTATRMLGGFEAASGSFELPKFYGEVAVGQGDLELWDVTSQRRVYLEELDLPVSVVPLERVRAGLTEDEAVELELAIAKGLQASGIHRVFVGQGGNLTTGRLMRCELGRSYFPPLTAMQARPSAVLAALAGDAPASIHGWLSGDPWHM